MQTLKSRIFWRRWLPVVLTAGLIFVLSSQSFQTLWPIISSNELSKGLHVAFYFLLSFFLTRALATGGEVSGRDYLVSFLLILVYAGLDEFRQTLTAGRDGSLVDVLLDFSGALLAMSARESVEEWRRVLNFLEWETRSSLD